MATFITCSPTALLFTFLLLQGRHVSLAAAKCSDRDHTCGEGGPTIRSPFYLSDNPEKRTTNLTDHQIFGLTCKNYTSQTMFKFPNSGEFVVDTIDYMNRRVQFRDSDGCLARRLRDPAALSGTYLGYDNYVELKFAKFLTADYLRWESSPYEKVGCLSGEGYGVFMGLGDFQVNPLVDEVFGCVDRWTEKVPSPREGWTDGGGGFPETFWLSWGQEFDCQMPEQSHSSGRSGFLQTKLGIILMTTIPWVTCIFCTLCLVRGSVHQADPTSAPPPDQQTHLTTITVIGMDMSAIELAFPKTQVGDTRQLPRVEDNTCSICLSEYQTEETLRTITECNHYFHADCVDEWLKKNATCPLCRNNQVYVLPRLLGSRSGS